MTSESKLSESAKFPAWVKQEYFENVAVQEIENFSKITSFNVESGSAPGENYATVMLRIQMKIELKDGSNQDLSLMMKTAHPSETAGAEMTQMFDVFDKECEVYEKLIPAFEKLYRDKGKKVKFGPKFYKLAKDPGEENIVLEDLKPSHFKNANRLEGLDLDHTKSVLKILAEYHAASAVHYENCGSYPEKFDHGVFDRSNKEIMVQMYSPMVEAIKEVYANYVDNGKHYAEMMVRIFKIYLT